MKKIEINGIEYILYSSGENSDVSIYPHMVEASSGQIPKGRQKRILTAYLLENGVSVEENATTHWCVQESMKTGNTVYNKVKRQPETVDSVKKEKHFIAVPVPSAEQVEFYLAKWDGLENYRLQEEALDKLFFELVPKNNNISDILIKAASLNDFYSTNIFSIFPVAKHILGLNIDERLKSGEESLVGDIQKIVINGTEKNFYSFATKYCSHHNPIEFPIYDSYVDKVLRYFRDKDRFSTFANEDLKDYIKFKSVLNDFRRFYNIDCYNLKEIDKYLWQLGKDYFPKNFGKKA